METKEIINDTTTILIISCIKKDEYLNSLYSKLDDLQSSKHIIAKESNCVRVVGYSEEISNQINELYKEIILRVEEITLFYKNKSYLNKCIHIELIDN